MSLVHHHDGVEVFLWGLMTLLGRECVAEPHPSILELKEAFHHLSFSRTKLVGGKGKQGHPLASPPTSAVQTMLIQSAWSRACALCLLLFPICCYDTNFLLLCFGWKVGGGAFLKFTPSPLFSSQNSQLSQIRTWAFKIIDSEFQAPT